MNINDYIARFQVQVLGQEPKAGLLRYYEKNKLSWQDKNIQDFFNHLANSVVKIREEGRFW
jgi:hypothetical protein